MKNTTNVALVSLAALSCWPSLIPCAFAVNGIYLTADGAAAGGVAGASIGFPQDSLVALDNPAGMSQIGSRLDIYSNLINTSANATFTSPQNAFSTRTIVPAPGFGVNYQIAPRWTVGLSVSGVGRSADYGRAALPLPGAGPAEASFTQINMAPTVTFAPVPGLAVGASILLGLQQYRANGLFAIGAGGSPVPLTSHGNAYASGIGGGFGLIWTPNDFVSLGASYFTKMHFSELRGYSQDLLSGVGGRIDSPSRYGIGMAVHISPRLIFTADILRLNWSDSAAEADPASFGWHDQNVARLGFAYEINSRWTARVGYSVASSTLDSDHTIAAFYAYGINDKAVTFGATYAVDKKNSISAALEYDIPRTIKGTGASTGTNISAKFQVYTIGYTHAF